MIDTRASRRLLGLLPAMLACLPAVLGFLAASGPVHAAQIDLPAIHFNLDDADAPRQISSVMTIVLSLTVLSIAPAFLILTTSFTRLAVVLSFLRHALGTQGSPPNQVIIGLAMFLTFFIMQPVWQQIQSDALAPYQRHEISGDQFLERGSKVLKDFMIKQTRQKDLALFVSFSQQDKPHNSDSLSLAVVIPAFVISELKTAFQIGFMLFLPFIILDMVVASILLSMGMMMLPPVMISLPFKLMLFVLVDGWNLLIMSLVRTFQ